MVKEVDLFFLIQALASTFGNILQGMETLIRSGHHPRLRILSGNLVQIPFSLKCQTQNTIQHLWQTSILQAKWLILDSCKSQQVWPSNMSLVGCLLASITCLTVWALFLLFCHIQPTVSEFPMCWSLDAFYQITPVFSMTLPCQLKFCQSWLNIRFSIIMVRSLSPTI